MKWKKGIRKITRFGDWLSKKGKAQAGHSDVPGQMGPLRVMTSHGVALAPRVDDSMFRPMEGTLDEQIRALRTSMHAALERGREIQQNASQLSDSEIATFLGVAEGSPRDELLSTVDEVVGSLPERFELLDAVEKGHRFQWNPESNSESFVVESLLEGPLAFGPRGLARTSSGPLVAVSLSSLLLDQPVAVAGPWQFSPPDVPGGNGLQNAGNPPLSEQLNEARGSLIAVLERGRELQKNVAHVPDSVLAEFIGFDHASDHEQYAAMLDAELHSMTVRLEVLDAIAKGARLRWNPDWIDPFGFRSVGLPGEEVTIEGLQGDSASGFNAVVRTRRGAMFPTDLIHLLPESRWAEIKLPSQVARARSYLDRMLARAPSTNENAPVVDSPENPITVANIRHAKDVLEAIGQGQAIRIKRKPMKERMKRRLSVMQTSMMMRLEKTAARIKRTPESSEQKLMSMLSDMGASIMAEEARHRGKTAFPAAVYSEEQILPVIGMRSSDGHMVLYSVLDVEVVHERHPVYRQLD